MVVPAALSAERLPAPSARAPRVPMALSLAVHGLAVILLFAAGAAGSSSSGEPALVVELAFAAPSAAEPESAADASQQPIELPPSEEPPPVDLSRPKPVDLAPPHEPPPVDFSELKPVEPPKPEPPKPEPPKPTPPQAKPKPARQAAAKAAPSANFASAGAAQQAGAGFLAVPAVVWEGHPRFRHPPTPATYPPRAIELNQQGEALVRVRLDPGGTAVEIVLHRSSGFALLDRAALAAVRRWHFLPAVRDGRAVSAWVEVPVRFHLR